MAPLATAAINDATPSSPLSFPVKPGLLPLYLYEEIPLWMRDNSFIRTGYRAHYTVRQCLLSLFTIHNETANIWTHLLGLLFFVAISSIVFISFIEPLWSHYVIFLLFSLSCMMCMGTSAAFHLFSAHYCDKFCGKMASLDYFGISCLVIGSFFPLCYYAFSCEPFWRWAYLGMISILGSVGIIGPFFEFFRSPEFFLQRILVFSAMTASGMFPTLHVLFILPTSSATPVVGGMALMLLMYLSGMIIYILRVPERWFPGQFDTWLHSHQLWHVFVFAAATVHYFTCLSMYSRWNAMNAHC